MKLSQAQARQAYTITACSAQKKAKARLDSLGLVVGETIFVISSSFSGQILDVKGSRLALCKTVADSLEVEKSE